MRLFIDQTGGSKVFLSFVESLSRVTEFAIHIEPSPGKLAARHAIVNCDAWLLFTDASCDATLAAVNSRPCAPRNLPLFIIDCQFQRADRERYLAAGVIEHVDYHALDITSFTMMIGAAVRAHRSAGSAQAEALEFDLLCNTLNVGSWEWNLRTNGFTWSSREYELFGIDASLDRIVYDSWRDAIHPGDRDRVEAELARAIVGQADYHSVFRVQRHVAGQVPTLHWIEGVGRVQRDEHGAALQMHGLNWDVTAKHKALADLEASRNCSNCLSHHSKNPFQAYFEQSADCLFHIVETADGRLQYTAMNPSGLQHAGVPIDQILGRTPSDVLGNEVGGAIEAGMRMAIRSGKPFVYKPTFDMGEGSVVYDAVYIPIKNESAEIVGVLGCARDITAGRQMEETLLQAQKMEALGQLTSGTAHDFNNILQSISSALDIAEYMKTPERRENALVLCRNAVKCGKALTSGLLAFSRREEMAVGPADLNALVNAMADMIRLTLGARIELHVEADPLLWPALISEQQIELAIINLAVNARDAMPEGGRLTIATRNVHTAEVIGSLAPGEYVCLSVADTGTGMSADVLSKAMTPFYTTKPAGKGTGLGLSMVRSTAAGLGGELHIASVAGQGTAVAIYLRRAQAMSDSELGLVRS